MPHLCFNASGAATLRHVLAKAGREATVFTSFDDLSQGPVTDVCGEDRRRWAEAHYGKEAFNGLWSGQVAFWTGIAGQCSADLTVWVNRRSAVELTGFLEFLWRLPAGAAFALGDCTDKVAITPAETGRPYVLTSTGALNIAQWTSLLPSAERVSRDMFPAEVQGWARLKQENAPLRAFVGGHLMSVPVDHHDGDILASIWPGWRRTHRVVSECLALMPANADHTQVSDLFILERMDAMADAGLIEFRGRPEEPAFEVRLKDR